MGISIKWTLLFVFLLSTGSIASPEEARKEPNWQPVPGFVVDGAIIRFDKNSFLKKETEKGNFHSGDILVSHMSPQVLIRQGKTFTANSMVSMFVMECNTGLTHLYANLYFKEKFPNRNSAVIHGEKFPVQSATTLPKSTGLYHILCPIYI